MRNAMTVRRSALIAAGVVLGAMSELQLAAQSQTRDATPPAFEVASVKPNKSGDWRKGMGPAPGGRFTATNVTFRDLVPFAYGLSQAGRPQEMLFWAPPNTAPFTETTGLDAVRRPVSSARASRRGR
jgi:hypothetical protein